MTFARSSCLIVALGIFSLSISVVSAQHDYKVSRNLIRAKKYQEAQEVLKGRLNKFPEDSEWVYQNAIVLAQLGEIESASEVLQQAIKMGVPLGRIAADSRDLLKPLAAQESFQKILASQNTIPIQGPMLGQLTSTSAAVWLRTISENEVQARAINRETKQKHLTEKMNTTLESDYTAVVAWKDLSPNTTYDYEILLNGSVAPLKLETTFQTFPDSNKAMKFSIAFGGGSGYVTDHEYMWNTIATEKPKALLLLGDNIYSDDPKSQQMQRFCYYRRQSPDPFRKLVAKTAVYSIWDDHDFGTNDCSGGPKVDQPEWKIPVWKTYQNNWLNPSYGQGESQPGCWYDFSLGKVQFIMLDGRYYRDRPSKTMLGPVQKKWLKETLSKSTAMIKVLVSPVPWEYRTKGDSKDTWNGFKDERDEIFNYLTEKKIEGVLLMSADRHRSDAWKIERENDYPLYEFNSSRLTNNHVHPTMKEAIFSYNKKQSFGLVTFDFTQQDPKVNYTVISIDGEKVHSMDLKLSQLK